MRVIKMIKIMKKISISILSVCEFCDLGRLVYVSEQDFLWIFTCTLIFLTFMFAHENSAVQKKSADRQRK